jgi:hypothetical protein
MKRKRKPTKTMATLAQISSIRHLRLNKRGGRPGANVSPIVNCLQYAFTTKSLLSKPSTSNTLWTRPLPNWNLQEWWNKTLQMLPSRTNVTNCYHTIYISSQQKYEMF